MLDDRLRLHYKRVRLLVDGLIYSACSPCSFAVFPHGTVVLYSGMNVVPPDRVRRRAQKYLRRSAPSAKLPAAYRLRGSPIWLMCLQAACCNGPTIFGVYFSQNGDDDDALQIAAQHILNALMLDTECHPVCTSSNPSERQSRDSYVSERNNGRSV